MLTIFDSWRKSLESFEDIDAVKYRKKYHALVSRTPVADKEIMERLGLEELPDLTFRPMEKAEPVYIKRHQYMWVHEQWHVGTFMKDTFKVNLCLSLMSYLLWIKNRTRCIQQNTAWS